MKIKEVSVSVARTINLGNYESAKVEVGLVADVGPDENSDEVFALLYNDARRKLIARVEQIVS